MLRAACRRWQDLDATHHAASTRLLLAEAYARSFARYGQAIGQVLLTADDMIRRAHYRNAQRTLERTGELRPRAEAAKSPHRSTVVFPA